MSGPIRWLVLFFTRPIHRSDVAAFFRKLKPRSKQAGGSAPAAPRPKRRAEPADSVPVPARARASSGPIRAAPLMMRDKLDVAVSEQPVDTLPAALRDELLGVDKSAGDAAARGGDDQRTGVRGD